MWKDSIVEETRKVREVYAARFKYNLEAIYKDIKKQENQSSQKIISLSPKKPIQTVKKVS